VRFGDGESLSKAAVEPAGEVAGQFEVLTLVLADGSEFPAKGRVTDTLNQVDPKTGTLELQASFPNPRHTLLPGQFGRIRVQVDERKDAIEIPQKAVQQIQSMQAVYTVGPDNKALVRAIVTGNRTGELWIVEQGLKPGDEVIATADDNTKTLTIRRNGEVIKTMPISMGKNNTPTSNGVFIIGDRFSHMIMDSSTYGLPVNSAMGYKLKIPFATRISTDGIYLHQLNATVWAQGNTDTSHGCLNLSGENAAWYYDFSRPGDVVEVRNTGGPPLQVWQNGDWTMP